MTPLISLCHTTARLPEGWKKAMDLWFRRCDHPELIEYILGIDEGEEFPDLEGSGYLGLFPRVAVVVNRGRKCAVDGWNATAMQATGQLLITVADDWYPCEHWDTELLRLIPNLDGEYVVKVETGGDSELLTFSIVTRVYFDRLTREYGYQGGFFYPEYISMYADNEFTDLAQRDRVILDGTNLTFEHDHPLYTGAEMDDIHKRQHRPEAFEVGEAVYERRRAELKLGPSLLQKFGRPFVACCLPGSDFSACWLANWTNLFAYLITNYRVLPFFAESSNVYAVRAQLASDALQVYPHPHFLLWIDSDNILSPKQFGMLMQDLEDDPTLDAVGGWCWDKTPGLISAGMFDDAEPPDPQFTPLPAEWLSDGPGHIKRVDWSGFPALLMRSRMLEKAGRFPFAPIVSEAYRFGMSGEDTAFCKRARDAGCRLAIDRRVKVEHLKLLPEQNAAESPALKRSVA